MTHRENLLERAIAAMVSALEVYNKPTFRYRAESFTILAINAWELLVKAKWLLDNDDDISNTPANAIRSIQTVQHKSFITQISYGSSTRHTLETARSP
ncbi:MAG: DUF3644 domain-containing protein [Bacillota bacterium]|jgi:hypothetical protein